MVKIIRSTIGWIYKLDLFEKKEECNNKWNVLQKADSDFCETDSFPRTLAQFRFMIFTQ